MNSKIQCIIQFFNIKLIKEKCFLMFYVVDAITLIVKITSWLHWAAMPVKSLMQLGDKILKKKRMQQYNH